MYCDNEAVYKNIAYPNSVLKKKMHSISYHFCREAVAAGIVQIAKEDTRTNLLIYSLKSCQSHDVML